MGVVYVMTGLRKNFWTHLRNTLAWTVVGVIAILGSLWAILIGILGSVGAVHKLTVWLAKMAMWVLGISYSVRGESNVKPATSYVVTPNHQSYSDVLTMLSALPFRFRWMLKKELLNMPLLGRGLSTTGAIPVDRSNPRKAAGSLKQACTKLIDGWSILVYPEGTTSPNGELLPFKKGPFVMAVQSGVPVLPVTCNGPSKILPRGAKFVSPGHVTITIGKPIETAGMTDQDIASLMAKTRAEINKHLDPNYNPFDTPHTPESYDQGALSA